MKKRTKRILTVTFAILLITGSLVTWGAIRVVAWARDLPNRIVIDGDAIAQSIGDAMTQSYHDALTTGDTETRAKVIQNFSELASDKPGREWIQSEFSGDLNDLSSSTDSEVAELATTLLEQLGEQENANESPMAEVPE